MVKKLKRVVITGGTEGIGFQIVKKYLKEGWSIIVISKNCVFEDPLTSKQLKQIKCFKCDLTKKEEIENVVNELKNVSIDCVVSNVGNGSGSRDVFPSDEEWDKIWDINFTTSKNTAKYFYKFLEKNKGSLIFISSIAGMEYLDAPIAYSVSKSALISYSKILSKKLAPKVKVNVIVPGNIITKNGVWAKNLKNKNLKTKKYINQNVPLKTLGSANEIAELVYFISSNKVDFMSGSSLVIDGGQTNYL